MAKPSPLNPLRHIVERQYKDNVFIKNKIFKERLAKARNLYRKDLLAHYGCVNAIEFSAEGDLLVSGGDDRRVLLWSIPPAMYGKGSPVEMETNHNSNIFCLAFNSGNTKIFSGGNDDQVFIHDAITGNFVGKLMHRKPVYGLSVNPQNDNVLATAGDDGRILLFDVRESPNSDALCLAKQKTGFHSVMFNPINPRWLATANSEEGIALWDCRKPKELLIHYDATAGPISGISACFNSDGSRVLALRRRLPPVLYATQKENAICQFYHPQYYNSCTMKTCCFAGDGDEYVLSGSDDFNLYMWRMPQNDTVEWGKSHLVLRGHRSIVNQVRYNKENNLIASSGVEKMIKLWSSLPIGTWKGSLQKEHTDVFRSVYTHEDYVYLVGRSGERISHDYSDQSTQEDSKMLAFFDSLIQREIEGWESPSENSDFSDSDSDGHERNVQSLLNEMFCNGKVSSEDTKKHKSNRIAQLIAKKRSRLARMAHDKSSSQVLRYHLKEKNRKKKNSQKSKTSKLKKNGSTKKSPLSSRHSEKDHKHKFVPERTKLRKYRTRQSLRETCDSGASNNSFDAPSTSTGITSSSNSVFRVIEQDSDEDVPPNNCTENGNSEENNFVNILPTPLNGTHDMYINVLEMSSANVVTVRNEGAEEASTSNGPPACSVRGAFAAYETESDSDYSEFDYRTPVKKRRVSASDSGCGTGPCSSTSPYPIRGSRNHQECSSNDLYNNERDSEDEFNYEKFKKRVSKARINIRKQIGGESDSN
ncbi:DDB1- and CUL4-associated factor 5 isoform X2 [Tribolium madens]|uniref:DDB1- and CUL4-associated factor 5 isoform X2 n=1 Tax=Tribolium madens TaxID=41895 RepID=UPI001CF73714|nr:DDB1- and CUL4-associated factor 5 isoform X2 [Tribolium madens]